jgi:hypothetical protein
VSLTQRKRDIANQQYELARNRVQAMSPDERASATADQLTRSFGIPLHRGEELLAAFKRSTIMETPPFLIDQLAAERKVSRFTARRALYIQGCAAEGRTVRDVAQAMRIAPEGIKRLARRFLIDFPDYRPFAKKRDAGEEIAATSRNIHEPADGLPLFGR